MKDLNKIIIQGLFSIVILAVIIYGIITLASILLQETVPSPTLETYSPALLLTPTLSETPSPTDTAIPTATETQANTLKAKIQADIIGCDCGGNGNYGTVQVTIEFINGEPIFQISGQEPVKSRIAKFNVPLGSSIYLTLESSDGLRWEGPVEIPNHCVIDEKVCNQPQARPTDPPTQCNDGKDNDFDFQTDYPDDPGCDSKNDDSESPWNPPF